MAILIKSMGFVLSLCPFVVLEGLTNFLGALFVAVPSGRRTVLFSNLQYAFPDRSGSEIKKIARESAARMIEMGFFSLCHPFLGAEQLRRSATYSKEAEEKIMDLQDGGEPVIVMIPHVCLFETLATSPFFRPSGDRKLGAVYRPNRNKSLDEWINSARLKTGIVTFSREDGFARTKEFLKQGNWLAILFDQNAGNQGTLSLFLDRVASITTLPDILQKATKARAVFACPRRVGFFQSSVELTELDVSGPVSFQGHDCLSRILAGHPRAFPEWLWSHAKWKTHFYPEVKFGLQAKRSNLPAVLPRKLVFFVRMPNWLGDVVMAVPTLSALITARPDVKFILICKPQFKPLLDYLGLGDEVVCPGNVFSLRGIKSFLRMRRLYAQCHFLYTNSFRGDFEAWLTGAAHRFGLKLPGRQRPLLTHSYEPEPKLLKGEGALHQSEIWTRMCKRFGLGEKVDYSPLVESEDPSRLKIGIVLGSENNPAKRWPTDNWSELCRLFLESGDSLAVTLYGTDKEKSDAYRISSELKAPRLTDMTGKTNLSELAKEFLSCSLVVGCDSGGVHLSNSMGARTVVLFGPTNPAVTKPSFASPLLLVKAKGSESAADDSAMSILTPSEVFRKCRKFLHEPG